MAKQMRPWVGHAITGALVTAAVLGYQTMGPRPAPPKPGPLPKPVDTLLQRMQTAYGLDKSNANFKVGQKLQLVGLYQAMIDHSKDKTVATLGQLLGDLRVLASKHMAPGTLIDVRRLVADEAVKELGTDPNQQMTDAVRAKCVDFWTKISDALNGVQ